MRDADLEQMQGPAPATPGRDYKVAPKFKVAKISRQIRRIEADRKVERELAAHINLALLGVLNSDGSWKF
jgi:hypothetical protein